MEELFCYKEKGIEILEKGVEIPQGVPTFDFSDFKYVQRLGRGSVGEAHKLHKLPSGDFFTLKRILILNEERDDEAHNERIMHDMKLATSLHHPNIMQCIGVCKNEYGIYFLYDFMPCNLSNSIIRDQVKLAEIAYQVLKGLIYLKKEKGFVFKHLTPSSILYDPSNGLAKIADVGIVKDKHIVMSGVMMPSYMRYIAPENFHIDNDECDLQSERYNKSDAWSLGLCLLKFYMGMYPWDAHDDPRFVGRLSWYLCSGMNFEYGKAKGFECEAWPPRPPSDAPPLFREFVSLCLNLDVSKRAGVEELLKHEFITSNCSVARLDNAHGVIVSEQGDSSDDTKLSDDHMYECDHLELPRSSENDGSTEHQNKKPRLSAETIEGTVMENPHRR